MLQSRLRPRMLHSTHTHTHTHPRLRFLMMQSRLRLLAAVTRICPVTRIRPVVAAKEDLLSESVKESSLLYQLSSAPCTSFVEPTIDALLCARPITHPSCAALSPHLGASCCAFLYALTSSLAPVVAHFSCALISSSLPVVAPFSALSPSGYFVEPTINPISPEPACAVGFRSLNFTIDYGVSCCAVGFNASSGDKYLICCCGGDDRIRSKRTSLNLNFE